MTKCIFTNFLALGVTLTGNFSHRIVGIAITARYVPTNKREDRYLRQPVPPLPVYARRVKAKVVKARPRLEVTPVFSAVARVNGDNGLGPIVGSRAMETAIEMAKTAGFAFVGVQGSNHFGVGAYYVQKATREGLIGFATSNAPPNMAPSPARPAWEYGFMRPPPAT